MNKIEQTAIRLSSRRGCISGSWVRKNIIDLLLARDEAAYLDALGTLSCSLMLDEAGKPSPDRRAVATDAFLELSRVLVSIGMWPGSFPGTQEDIIRLQEKRLSPTPVSSSGHRASGEPREQRRAQQNSEPHPLATAEQNESFRQLLVFAKGE